METETIPANVLTIGNGQIKVSIEALNKLLEPYDLRIDSPDDIFLDAEATRLNGSDTLKAYLVDTKHEFDMESFVSREVEDKMEAMEGVFGVDINKGDSTMLIALNTKNCKLIKEFAQGGAVAEDPAVVDNVKAAILVKMGDGPQREEIYKLVGVKLPHKSITPDKIATKDKEVVELAIKKYLETPELSAAYAPVMAFYNGYKFKLSQDEDTAGMQALTNHIQDAIVISLKSKLGAQANDQYIAQTTLQKSIEIIDSLIDRIRKSGKRVYYISDDELKELLKSIGFTTNDEQPTA